MSEFIKLNEMKKAAAMLVLLAPVALIAETAATPAVVPASGQNDMMWYLIISVMAILLFAVLILGNMLISLAKVTVEKNKAKAAAVVLLLFASGALFAQDAAATQPSGTSTLGTNWNMIMASCVMLAELFVIIVLLLRIRTMINSLSENKEKKAAFEIQVPNFFDKFNASVAIEKEKDILLDHNYDGIRELNNNLPPWWKYSFYISIVFAICYMSYYHIMGGPSSRDEYEASMKKAQEQQQEYARLNAGKVDENSITLADAAGISEGKTIFTTNCAACHGAAGQGIVGPNLTDDYWLHGGSLSDMYKSVKNGWPAKGMKSWSTDLSPVQIKNVVSYIKTLRGTNPPNGKAPQGDLYSEGGTNAAQSSTDTAKANGI